MIKRDLQNKKLDRIGQRLVKAAKVSDQEIEKIVAAPYLFDSIKGRIKAEEQSRRNRKRFLGEWASVFVWNRQTMAGAFAIFLVLATFSAFVVVLNEQTAPQRAEQIVESESRPLITQNEKQQAPAALEIEETEIEETNLPAAKKTAKIERAAFKPEMPKTPVKSPNQARKSNSEKQAETAKKQTPEVFYSLPGAANWAAAGDDLQIIRAELSKSELSALGVSLPVENDFARVKTDLLVSTAGMAVAIRFVE